MIGQIHQLASYSRINGSGTGNYVSATMSTRDVDQDDIGVYFIIHSLTATCPTNPSAQIWIEKGISESLGFKIPTGTNSYSVVNTNTTHIFNFSTCVQMPYTRICVGMTSGTPSAFYSAYVFYQDQSV